MKLKTYNPQTMPQRVNHRAAMSMNSKTGYVRFNISACMELGLTEKTPVEICQDEEKPSELYVCISGTGYDLRSDSKKDRSVFGLMFQNKILVKTLFRSLGITDEFVRITIGSEPDIINKVKYWPLITAALKGGKS